MRGDQLGVVRGERQRQDHAGPPPDRRSRATTLRSGTAQISPATLDQGRESLDPDLTISEALTGGRGDTVIMGDKSKHVVGYMQDFLFTPEQARTRRCACCRAASAAASRCPRYG